MTQIKSIFVFDLNANSAGSIKAGLAKHGLAQIVVTHDSCALARRIAEAAPDVIIISLQDPTKKVLENMFQLVRAAQRPVAVFIDRAGKATMEAAIEAGVSAFIVNGLAEDRIMSVVDMAIARFDSNQRMAKQLAEAKSQLEDRKIIDRAKGFLMSSRQMDEASAYGLLRSTAMKQNRTIVDLARSLVTAAQMLGPQD